MLHGILYNYATKLLLNIVLISYVELILVISVLSFAWNNNVFVNKN